MAVNNDAFSGIGSLFDPKPSKQFKEGRGDTLAALYGPGTEMGDIGPARMLTGTSSNPFASASYGPQGAGYQFSPEMQGLFNQSLGNIGSTQGILDKYFGKDFLTKGPLFNALNQSRIGRVEAGEDAAANTLSKIFNLGGVSTGTGMQSSQIINQLNAAKAQEDYNVMANLFGLRGTTLGQLGTNLGQMAGFENFGRNALQDAMGLSSDLTNLDLQKLNLAIGANNSYRQAKSQDTGLGAQLGGIAGAGLAAYGAGGGSFGDYGALSSMASGMYPKQTNFMDFLKQFGLGSNGPTTPEYNPNYTTW